MKRPRNVERKKLNPKIFKYSVKKLHRYEAISRGSFSKLSVPLFFSFWCLVVFFHSKIGLTNGNEGVLHVLDESITNSSVSDKSLWNHTVPALEYIENQTSRVVIEVNVSVIINGSARHDNSSHLENARSRTSGLDKLISNILGYNAFMCRMEPQDDEKPDMEQQPNGRIQLANPINLDEFRYMSNQDKNGNCSPQLVNITHRLEPDGTPFNYASAAKGAKVVAHNKEAKGASNVLGKDHDKYLRNPCSVDGKFLIIELASETLVDTVKIANFEHYSSNFKDFELYGSLVYPTDSWHTLGAFVAANVKQAQTFKLPEPKWVRYLKVNFLSHYGSEFYCTLSVVEVYGIDAIEQMLEDLIVTSDEASANRSPNPNTTTMPSVLHEPASGNHQTNDDAGNVVEAASKGVGSVGEGQNPPSDTKKTPIANSIPDPLPKSRQHPSNRLHPDAALKVVLQKVRSLELNLSVLEEYIKGLNKRQGEVLPELGKEISRFSALLEKRRAEMQNLMEWKELMEKEILDQKSWSAAFSSQMELLVTENSLLRLEVEKVLQHQMSLENKQLAILTVSFFFVCIAALKLLMDKIFSFFHAPDPTVSRSSRGWTLVLIFCSITMLIPLIYG